MRISDWSSDLCSSDLVAIEGLGMPPAMEAERALKSVDQRMRDWIVDQRKVSGRQSRRYSSIEEALTRMQEENGHLTPSQARHQIGRASCRERVCKYV